MTKLTKEQLERFNEHFMLTEVTHDVSTYVCATDDLEQLNELNSEEIGNGFMYLNSELVSSNVQSSDGYAIERKHPRAYVKEVYEVFDLVEFIQEQMDNEIKRESEHK